MVLKLWCAIFFACVLTSVPVTGTHPTFHHQRVPVHQTPLQGSPQYQAFDKVFLTYINNAVDKVMHCYNITGLSLAIIDRRQAVNNTVLKFTKGYGVKDLTTNEPVDENTKFAIGSITKSFTAATFANLSTTALNHNTLVAPILQQYFNATLSNNDQHFNDYGNMRDLLSHRTGIIGVIGPLLTGSDLSVVEMVKAINSLPDLPRALGGGFRESFSYNNWMYALAGAVLANSVGKDWKSLINGTILQPWNIGSKFIADLEYGKDNVAMPIYLYANESIDGGYDYFYKQYDLRSLPEWLGRQEMLSPCGAIAASAEDMSRYIEFWNVGGFGTIPPATLTDELNNPQTPLTGSHAGVQPPQFNYWDIPEYYTAFGLGRGIHNDSVKFSHGGGIGPYISQFSFFMAPYPQYGVFISTNGPGGQLALTAVAIVEQAVLEALATNGQPRVWTLENLCVVPVNLSSFVPHPKPLNTDIVLDNVNAYAGQYKHPLMGTANITAFNSTHLRWTLGTVGTGFMARSTQEDLWQFDTTHDGYMEWIDSSLQFNGEWTNRTALFLPGEDKKADAVILRFQLDLAISNGKMGDGLQPVFKRISN